MQGSPALHGLIETSTLGLNRFDLDRLGVESGDVVSVSGAHGSISLPVALNKSLPRGTAEIAFGTLASSGENVLSVFLEHTGVITQIRLETR
jgi:anaerobic selenocysteine-containing dehydrogenase